MFLKTYHDLQNDHVYYKAGLITLEKQYWLSEMRDDPEGLSRKLAEQKPYWTPGWNFTESISFYHTILTFNLTINPLQHNTAF